MSLREDLIAAKALIDTPEKWVKGTWGKDGGYCSAGAIVAALNLEVDGAVWSAPAYMALERQVMRIDDDVVAFNDAPDTTHADIMALFDRAIKAAS